MSVNGYGLGRRFSRDDRDHPLRAALAETRPLQTKIHPMFSKHLDQGNEGTCVGHAWRHLLTGTPRPYRNPVPHATTIYDKATQIDEWAENDRDYARQFGTSTRAGAKVLQSLGLLSAYGFAPTFAAALAHLSHHGPGPAGTIWPRSLSAGPDRSGFVKLDRASPIDGGHCYLWYGLDLRRGAIRCLQSWDTWGPFWLAMEDAEWLFDRGGEFCAPQERARVEETR